MVPCTVSLAVLVRYMPHKIPRGIHVGIINTINGYKKAQSTSSFCSTAPVLRGESTGWCAGPNTGLGLENMKHVISIHDVVSDTMHQFAPTYHNYVLYSNQGSKEAPKTVSPSAQQHKQWLCSMLCSLLCAFTLGVVEVAAEHAGILCCLGLCQCQ